MFLGGVPDKALSVYLSFSKNSLNTRCIYLLKLLQFYHES